MKNNKPRIVVIAGPTASGKSDIGIRLAKKFNGEIISADSRQVYRGMDIGSGKVTNQEQKLVRHWMLDVASPTRQYSVVQWRKGAEKAIADITRRGKLPIIVGGTGFWIDTLVHGTRLPDVKPNTKLRARLSKLSANHLYAKLKRLDPARAAAIDAKNPVRLIRALEIVMTTGKPVPPSHRASPYHVLYLATRPQNHRIAKRLDARLKHGMIAEVKKLRDSGVSWKRLESFGLEYRWLARFLQKKISKQEMRERLLYDIIHYAKRQLTWLRRNKEVISISQYTDTLRLTKQFLMS